MKATAKILLALALFPVMLCQSCSLKEDRTVCPCILNIDWSSVWSDERISDSHHPDSVFLLIGGKMGSFVRMSDYPEGQEVSITRSQTTVDCYLGLHQERLRNNSSRLVIPFGEDGDRLFSCHRYVEPDINTEEINLTPVLSNEYTKVILEFDPEESSVSPEDNILEVKGGTCGLDLRTGKAIKGDFLHELESYKDRSWCFNMPRQSGKDISIDIFSRAGQKLLFSIDLAGELDAAGYDFSAESLAPLVIIKVSSRNVPVEVRIIDWDEAVYLNYTL